MKTQTTIVYDGRFFIIYFVFPTYNIDMCRNLFSLFEMSKFMKL